jgi:hypothetical protein
MYSSSDLNPIESDFKDPKWLVLTTPQINKNNPKTPAISSKLALALQ